jgi:hypothetical protein
MIHNNLVMGMKIVKVTMLGKRARKEKKSYTSVTGWKDQMVV